LQFTNERLDRQAVMLRDLLKHTVQQSDFERTMIRNTDMMLAAALGGKLNVRSSLPPRFIAETT
jgi:hypothetical protein